MMLFDVQAALSEILGETPAHCDSRDSCDFSGPESQQSRESQSQPAEIAEPAKVLPFQPQPSAPPPSQHAEAFPHGLCPTTGKPRTWTGKIVSLDDWRRLSDWERHGSTGMMFCGICRAWALESGGCPHSDGAKGGSA